jgi:uncharacterized protein (DUF169 family)
MLKTLMSSWLLLMHIELCGCEMVHGLSGSAWCTNSFPLVYKTKTMTYNMGDEQSRVLMKLDPGEQYCLIHYDLLPLIVENIGNIQTGLAM